MRLPPTAYSFPVPPVHPQPGMEGARGMLHPTVKTDQSPALSAAAAERSLTTRAVPSGIKGACLDQQIPLSC